MGFSALLLLSVQRDLAQVVVFEVEWVTSEIAVECLIMHESDHDA